MQCCGVLARSSVGRGVRWNFGSEKRRKTKISSSRQGNNSRAKGNTNTQSHTNNHSSAHDGSSHCAAKGCRRNSSGQSLIILNNISLASIHPSTRIFPRSSVSIVLHQHMQMTHTHSFSLHVFCSLILDCFSNCFLFCVAARLRSSRSPSPLLL